MPKTTGIDPDFKADDTDYAYCETRFGYPKLADYFLEDFLSHHQAKGTRMAEWHIAFKNWIRWASPRGRFYNAREWENAIARSKSPIRKRTPPPYHPNPQEEKFTPKPMSEYGRNILAQLREQLK